MSATSVMRADHRLHVVPRLPYVDREASSPSVQDVLARVPPLNIFRMAAHADTAFVPWIRWAGALLSELELDALLRELAILRVARLTPHAEYEWVQHVPIAEAVGATKQQVAALERDDEQADCFSEQQRVVLRFTTEVVRDARATDPTMEAVRQHLSPREIVELLMVIGNYMMIARVMATTDMELDRPAGPDALNAARQSD
jgi:4-carboxymuconolactone decarboxylase